MTYLYVITLCHEYLLTAFCFFLCFSLFFFSYLQPYQCSRFDKVPACDGQTRVKRILFLKKIRVSYLFYPR